MAVGFIVVESQLYFYMSVSVSPLIIATCSIALSTHRQEDNKSSNPNCTNVNCFREVQPDR